MAVQLRGNTSAVSAETTSVGQLKVQTPQTESEAGFVQASSEVDSGSVTGSRTVRALEVTDDFRTRIGMDTLMFSEYFPGTALNSAVWTAPVTTMAVAVANGLCTLNSGSSTANGAVAQVRTYRHFPCYGTFGVYAEMILGFAVAPTTNNTCEWGLGLAATTAAPTDGAFFRITTLGGLICVLNNNGTEITVTPTGTFASLIGVNTQRHFIINLTEDYAYFWIDDVLVASIKRSVTGAAPTRSQNLPVFFRTYNGAVTAVAMQMNIAHANVTMADNEAVKNYRDQIAGAGCHSSQGQTGGTMGSTANYANSANPTAAVPTNTTAALGSGLGGQFWETDTLAVTTDGIICSYQVPAGTAAIPGKSLYITQIGISSYVQTVLVGGPYIAQWSLAYGHTAVSLGTAEAATTKAPRRLPLPYTQAVTAAQAVSTKVGTDFWMTLDTPIVVQPGGFVALVKKKVGTAPSSGVIAHVITINGYME